MIHRIAHRERRLFVGAIDGGGTGIDEMGQAGQRARQFQHHRMAHHVGGDIGEGVFQAVAHPRLGREVDDRADAGGGQGSDHAFVGDVGTVKREILVRRQCPQTRLLQAHIIIRAEIVHADDAVTARQKRCMVSGWPSGVGGPEEYSEEWIFTPGQVTMTGAIGFVRRIHTDGRKHHAGPGTIEADSIGHWEGDTLVVDTSSAQEGNELYYGFVGGKNMHGIERIHLSDQNTLTIDLDLDAPDIFSTAYKFPTRLKRHADWTTLEMNCAQNQRSVDEKGNQTMILDKQSYSAGKDEE